MAKIFSTEKLSINEDSIRIKSSTSGAFEITDAADNVLISRSTIESDVASLNTQDSTNKSTLDSSIASLAGVISTNDVYADNASVSSGDSSITIDYTSVSFTSAPAVVGTLRSTGANDPIIGVQLSGAPSTSSATFVFSDSIPSANYTFDVLASI